MNTEPHDRDDLARRARDLWHGAVRPIAVIAAEGQPLIGMALLRGSRLSVEALPGGEVTVSEL